MNIDELSRYNASRSYRAFMDGLGLSFVDKDDEGWVICRSMVAFDGLGQWSADEFMATRLVEANARSLLGAFSLVSRVVGSPIELRLLYAMTTVALERGIAVFLWRENLAACQEFGLLGKQRIELSAQFQIGDYSVDFLMTGLMEGDSEVKPVNKVVVECDGHDFHERTKEQAASDKKRDRDIQAAGYQVLRFTGSEIFARPYECAIEVINLAFTNRT